MARICSIVKSVASKTNPDIAILHDLQARRLIWSNPHRPFLFWITQTHVDIFPAPATVRSTICLSAHFHGLKNSAPPPSAVTPSIIFRVNSVFPMPGRPAPTIRIGHVDTAYRPGRHPEVPRLRFSASFPFLRVTRHPFFINGCHVER